MGIEPTTYALRVRCSTTELSRQGYQDTPARCTPKNHTSNYGIRPLKHKRNHDWQMKRHAYTYMPAILVRMETQKPWIHCEMTSGDLFARHLMNSLTLTSPVRTDGYLERKHVGVSNK